MNLAVIPARLESQRLPKKVIRDIAGKSMIHRVWENTVNANLFDWVIVAGDSTEIKDHLPSDADFILTGDCRSGTDRVHMAIEKSGVPIENTMWIANIQADQPCLEKEHYQAILEAEQEETNMATLVCTSGPDDSVRAAVSCGRAYYFSRSPIAGSMHHIGVYAYDWETLDWIRSCPTSPLEQAENLEQLRAIEWTLSVCAKQVSSFPVDVNTHEDLEKARQYYLAKDRVS